MLIRTGPDRLTERVRKVGRPLTGISNVCVEWIAHFDGFC